jgi:glycerol kinase
VNTGNKRRSAHRLLSTAAWDIGGKRTYALEGSVFVTGAAIQWLRDGLGMLSNAEETEVLARRVPNTGGVYFVPALTGLGAPHWEPNARGLLMGITRGTTKAHLARAALEAIAYQVYDVAEAFERDAGVRLATLRVDGGGARNNFLLQFQADLLGVPVERPSFTEATAQGAAFLAGLGAGIWSSQDDLRKLTAIEARFAPAMDPAARERLLAEWHEAVAMTLAMARTGARGPPPEK